MSISLISVVHIADKIPMYVHVLCTLRFVEQTIALSTMEGVNISAIKEEGVTACLASSCQQMAKAVKVILVSHTFLRAFLIRMYTKYACSIYKYYVYAYIH